MKLLVYSGGCSCLKGLNALWQSWINYSCLHQLWDYAGDTGNLKPAARKYSLWYIMRQTAWPSNGSALGFSFSACYSQPAAPKRVRMREDVQHKAWGASECSYSPVLSCLVLRLPYLSALLLELRASRRQSWIHSHPLPTVFLRWIYQWPVCTQRNYLRTQSHIHSAYGLIDSGASLWCGAEYLRAAANPREVGWSLGWCWYSQFVCLLITYYLCGMIIREDQCFPGSGSGVEHVARNSCHSTKDRNCGSLATHEQA